MCQRASRGGPHLAKSPKFFYHKTLPFDGSAKGGDSPANRSSPVQRVLSVTILRVGTNQKYATGWDAAFGGKKAKASAVKKKASPKKKAAGKKKK
jgi:hypothetical protein